MENLTRLKYIQTSILKEKKSILDKNPRLNPTIC